VPTIIFSHPPIGTCGLSEQEAKKKYGEDKIQVFNSTFVNMFYSPMTVQDQKPKSLFKLVCLKTKDGEDSLDNRHLKVIGCHGIGKGIDEMLQGLSIAIVMGATKQDFDNAVAIHPTASEEWVLFEPKFETINEN